jgi:hypothetical protein
MSAMSPTLMVLSGPPAALLVLLDDPPPPPDLDELHPAATIARTAVVAKTFLVRDVIAPAHPVAG